MDSGFAQQGRMPKNNGLAIAGFVTSIVGAWCCLWPVSLGLSIAGLVQINKDPQYQLGKGLAIAGIVISALGLFVSFVVGPLLLALLTESGY
jgi:hypothetical protein